MRVRIILVSVLGLGLLGAVVYFLFVTSQIPQTPIPPTTGPTTEWNTYTNPLGEFSFEYPRDWEMAYNSTNSSLKPFTGGQTELSFFGPRSSEQQPGALRDAIGVDILNLRPADPDMDVRTQVLEFAKEYADPYYQENITELIMSGEKAFQTRIFTEGPDASMAPQVYIIGMEHGSKRLFVVVNIGVDMGSAKDYLKTLDQILSTFNFID